MGPGHVSQVLGCASSQAPSLSTIQTMSYRIVLTRHTRDQLDDLHTYIAAAANEGIARRFTDGILDYIGTATYGTTSQLGKIMLEFIREQGGNAQSRVIGTNIRTASAQAAFANGTTGHSEDFDDLGGCGGHPATVLTPTVLALADELHLSGTEVLIGWVVGYEIGTRLKSIAENRGGSDEPVFVRGDKAVSYGDIARVMGRIRDAGFRKISLVTEVEGGG